MAEYKKVVHCAWCETPISGSGETEQQAANDAWENQSYHEGNCLTRYRQERE